MRVRPDGWWLGGAAAGVAVAVLLAAHWRVPPAGAAPGVSVRVLAAPTGELGVSPVGAFVTATSLVAGGAGATGTVRVRNQTARRLSVAVEPRASSPELDEVVEVRFTTPDGVTRPRRLGLLQRSRPTVLHLAPAEEGTITVDVRVVRGATGYAGRGADITLHLVSRVAP